MTVVVVGHFYLAASGERESLGRSLVCLDLAHFISPFLSWVLPKIFKKLIFCPA
jgi:hypothetical protein